MPRALMIAGAVIFFAGAVLWLVPKTGLPLGRLPGDMAWTGKNVKIYVPVTTMIVVSVILTIILNILSRRR
jgi:ribose/xylose/arabinose/galactoside ABC-type transport system permease subunit